MRSKSVLFVVSVILIAVFAMSACAAPTAAPTEAPVAEVTEATVATATEAPTAVPTEAGILPEVDPSTVTGDIISAGSSTVYPLSEAIQALFEQEGYAAQHTLSSIGSGAGFERFCKTGEIDIANASRGIKDTEIEACAALLPARVPVEFRVGTDAIAVVVSKENTFLTNVTLEELAIIFTSATKWSDVNPEWPAEDILRFTPGTDSGTFDFFTEVVVQKPQKIEKLDDAKAKVLAATNLQTSEDDNTLVQGVEGSPYAIGYFGYAYFSDQAENLTAVSINDVAPSFETAEDGSYKLSRPLFIYSDAEIIKAKPQIGSFINFYLTRVNEVIGEVGYFPASEAALDEAKMKLADILAGKVTMSILPEVDPSTVTGDIISAGSSTVYPLSEAIQALFEQEGYAAQHTLSSIGSGAGFERFCKTGEIDIANASRGIKDTEVEACAALTPARVPVEFRVGTDAIAVVVSKENTFLTNVTLEELAVIFTTATKWSDVNPEWPAEDILRFTPGTDSGTFDFFTEVVVQKPQKIEKLDDAKALVLAATNLQTSEDDNTLVQGVEGSPYAIGYFGYAYFSDQAENLTAVSINDVAPSFETAEDGSYKLSRPLFIYSDAEIIKAKPQIGSFINFYLTRVNEVIGEVGYFPASETALDEAKMKLAELLK